MEVCLSVCCRGLGRQLVDTYQISADFSTFFFRRRNIRDHDFQSKTGNIGQIQRFGNSNLFRQPKGFSDWFIYWMSVFSLINLTHRFSHESHQIASTVSILFLCVLPSDVELVAKEIKRDLKENCIVVNLMAAIPIPKLKLLLDNHQVTNRPGSRWRTN